MSQDKTIHFGLCPNTGSYANCLQVQYFDNILERIFLYCKEDLCNLGVLENKT